MFASAIGKLAPGGRFFFGFHDAPGAAALDRLERAGPSWSTLEGPLRHHDYAVLERLVEAAGGRAERIGDWNDPHGQTMVVVNR